MSLLYCLFSHNFLQARHNGQNYVFALLTGYRDPPAGVGVSIYMFLRK